MGWQQRFGPCHDRLVLRVGGPGGVLITWPDRGLDGQCTWSWLDPEDEVRDLDLWVGDSPVIRLYAVVIETGATGSHGCRMETLYDGVICRAWALDSDEDHDVVRPARPVKGGRQGRSLRQGPRKV